MIENSGVSGEVRAIHGRCWPGALALALALALKRFTWTGSSFNVHVGTVVMDLSSFYAPCVSLRHLSAPSAPSRTSSAFDPIHLLNRLDGVTLVSAGVAEMLQMPSDWRYCDNCSRHVQCDSYTERDGKAR